MVIWNFVNTGPYGAGNLKCYSDSFHLVSAKIYEDILANMAEYRLLLFFVVGQVLRILWHFETLTLESMGKS